MLIAWDCDSQQSQSHSTPRPESIIQSIRHNLNLFETPLRRPAVPR